MSTARANTKKGWCNFLTRRRFFLQFANLSSHQPVSHRPASHRASRGDSLGEKARFNLVRDRPQNSPSSLHTNRERHSARQSYRKEQATRAIRGMRNLGRATT